MISPRRKSYLTAPGQRLILTSDMLAFAERVHQFVDDSLLQPGASRSDRWMLYGSEFA